MAGLVDSALPLLGHKILDVPVDPDGYAFNPAIMPASTGYTCIYRHVGVDQIRTFRRCHLDRNLRPASGHSVWSDEANALGSPVKWYADPRIFSWIGRNYINFNTGHSEFPNNIYLAEIDLDGRPLTVPILLTKSNGRRVVEKNWGFFGYGNELYAVYSLSPFVVLHFERKNGVMEGTPVATHHWQSEAIEEAFGKLHGGAAPLLIGDVFYVVVQSRTRTNDRYTYKSSLMCFEAKPPFRPLGVVPKPIFLLTEDEQDLKAHQNLNESLASCFYPCGAFLGPDKHHVNISYGINDYRCGIRTYAVSDLQNCLRPILPRMIMHRAVTQSGNGLRTFFWQPPVAGNDGPAQLQHGIFRFGNAGDSLQVYIATKLFGARCLNTESHGRRLLGAGSIAHRMQAGDVLWGTGYKDIAPTITREEAATVRAYAVRGPLTRDYLARHGVDVGKLEIFFDPGLLLAELFSEEILALRKKARRSDGVLYLPHYRHQAHFNKYYGSKGAKVGSMDMDLFDLCVQILESNLVVSSSLHGIIFAEALEVPAILHQPPQDEFFGKYRDYYLGTNRGTFPVVTEDVNPASVKPAQLPSIPSLWRTTIPETRVLAKAGILFPIHEFENLTLPLLTFEAGDFCEYVVDVGSQRSGSSDVQIKIDCRKSVRFEILQRDKIVFAGNLLQENAGAPIVIPSAVIVTLQEDLLRIRLYKNSHAAFPL